MSINFTCIIPLFNHEKCIQRAIRSILNQTYQRFNLIIVDDGSTDNSYQEACRIIDPRIQVIRQKNRGVSAARNRGILESGNEWIAFLDADDVWVEDKLYRQQQFINQNPSVDCLFGNYVNIHNNNRELGFDLKAKGLCKLTTEVSNNHFLIRDGFPASLLDSYYIAMGTVVAKRELFNKLGGFNEKLQNAEDLEFFWRVGLNDFMVAFGYEIDMIRYVYNDRLSEISIKNLINSLNSINSLIHTSHRFGRYDLVKKLRKRKLVVLHQLYKFLSNKAERFLFKYNYE